MTETYGMFSFPVPMYGKGCDKDNDFDENLCFTFIVIITCNMVKKCEKLLIRMSVK